MLRAGRLQSPVSRLKDNVVHRTVHADVVALHTGMPIVIHRHPSLVVHSRPIGHQLRILPRTRIDVDVTVGLKIHSCVHLDVLQQLLLLESCFTHNLLRFAR